MSLVLFLLRSSRALLAFALVASVVSGLGVSWLVALINASLAAPSSELPRLGVQFAALSLGMLLFRWLSQSLFVRLSQRTLAELRLLVSAHVAQAPYREIERQGAGRLMAVLTADIATVAELFFALPRLLVHGIVILGCLGYLLYLSSSVFLWCFGVAALGALAHYAMRRSGGAALAQARTTEDAMFSHFRALFTGAKELKQHRARREAFLYDVLGRSISDVESFRRRGLESFATAQSFRMFMFFAVIGLVVFVLGTVQNVPDDVRSGYALMLLYMWMPVHALLESTSMLGSTQVALQRILALGVRPAELEGLPLSAAPGAEPAPFEGLSLRGASYSYQADDGAAFRLGPLDVDLRPGELVFLVGGNGSGKTTLAKLLVGLYEPEAGQVAYNGVAVTEASRGAYRELFSCVFLDFHLFSSLLGLTDAGVDERARELLRALQLDHKVKLERGVFSTTELSSGQRKRLALLVATLEDRPVYVFDEWAADQDPVYKEVFYHTLLPGLKARGKAVLVITHDDRYFGLADRVLRLEAGRLVEPGVAAVSSDEPRASDGPRVERVGAGYTAYARGDV